jgi:hypothetical protein
MVEPDHHLLAPGIAVVTETLHVIVSFIAGGYLRFPLARGSRPAPSPAPAIDGQAHGVGALYNS